MIHIPHASLHLSKYITNHSAIHHFLEGIFGSSNLQHLVWFFIDTFCYYLQNRQCYILHQKGQTLKVSITKDTVKTNAIGLFIFKCSCYNKILTSACICAHQQNKAKYFWSFQLAYKTPTLSISIHHDNNHSDCVDTVCLFSTFEALMLRR